MTEPLRAIQTPTSASRSALGVECALLFFAIPAAFPLFELSLGWMFPVLFTITGFAAVTLARDETFDRRQLGGPPDPRSALPRMLRTTAIGLVGIAVLMAGLVAADARGILELPPQIRWFALPSERPGLWLLVMVLYPLLSVYPQEVTFRAFFCHRYRPLFGNDRAMLAVNALAFGWAHVMFENWVAVALCLIGGWLFADTYLRTRSLLLACIEHAIYGCALFTIGLGWFFYGGSVR